MTEECGDYGGTNRHGEPCGRTAGWGTDFDDGKCRQHRGTSPDGSSHEGNDNAKGNAGGAAPEGNTNAVTHALYVQSNSFYQDVIGDELRALCDEIFESYAEKFEQVNGAPPIAGEQARLSEIAINHIKIIHSDNWSAQRPDSLDSGNALVDKETRVKASQQGFREETRYKQSVVVKTQQKLRKEDRKWLKEFGLLGPDAVDVSLDGQVDHDHTHGLDEGTEELIEDLAEDLKA